MIPLKINGTKHNIPQAHELTTEQFIKLAKLGDFNIIDYLATVLNVSNKIAENIRIKNPAFISNMLYGYIPDYENMKPKKFIVLEGRRYNLNKDFTLGQRFVIEENGKDLKEFDLMLFCLAVNADYQDYERILEKINKAPASQIMPEAFFLSKNLHNGKSFAHRFLKKLQKWITTTH